MERILVIGDLTSNGGRFADLMAHSALEATWFAPDVVDRFKAVDDFLDRVAEPVILLAHGTGGFIALHQTHVAPERIKKLIVLDGPSALPSDLHDDPIGAATRIDAGVERLRALFADRATATATLIATGWLPATGMSRPIRQMMEAEIVGSGFGWRSTLSEASVTQVLHELTQFRPTWPLTVPTTVFRATHGHRRNDPPIELALESAVAITLDCTHDSLLWDQHALDAIATTINGTPRSDP